MQTVNISQARSSLSRLVKAINQGQQCEIVITRNGRPADKLVPVDTVPVSQRIRVAKGKFQVADTIDAQNEKVGRLFMRRGT